MVRVTRLNGAEFLVNCELIKFIEETPDTIVTLLSGEKLVVKEKADELVRRVIEYHRTIRAYAPAGS